MQAQIAEKGYSFANATTITQAKREKIKIALLYQ
jgi:hypothetical protein